jgi:rod shape-determining protein MreC
MAVGMPVMNANGLLGQVESVSLESSVVRLITDQNSGVAVMLQSSRTEGILTGSVEGLLYLQYIPLDIPVNVGDVVITSGAGGVYPKGIAIGEVSSVTSKPTDSYQTITIQPVSNVSTYEEVLVITSRTAEVTYDASKADDYDSPADTGTIDSSSTGGDATSGDAGTAATSDASSQDANGSSNDTSGTASAGGGSAGDGTQ